MATAPPAERHSAEALTLRLRELRNAVGLTQEQVGHSAGINRNHYQLLESGLSDRAKNTPANPRLSTLIALCEVYGTTVPDLVNDVFGPPDNPRVEYVGGHRTAS